MMSRIKVQLKDGKENRTTRGLPLEALLGQQVIPLTQMLKFFISIHVSNMPKGISVSITHDFEPPLKEKG